MASVQRFPDLILFDLFDLICLSIAIVGRVAWLFYADIFPHCTIVAGNGDVSQKNTSPEEPVLNTPNSSVDWKRNFTFSQHDDVPPQQSAPTTESRDVSNNTSAPKTSTPSVSQAIRSSRDSLLPGTNLTRTDSTMRVKVGKTTLASPTNYSPDAAFDGRKHIASGAPTPGDVPRNTHAVSMPQSPFAVSVVAVTQF